MHIRWTGWLQSVKPGVPNARTWNTYVVPGVRFCTGTGFRTLAAVIFVHTGDVPPVLTGAHSTS